MGYLVYRFKVGSTVVRYVYPGFDENPLNLKYLGAVSLKLLGGKLAPQLIDFVLKKELLNFSETALWAINQFCSLLQTRRYQLYPLQNTAKPTHFPSSNSNTYPRPVKTSESDITT